MSNISKSEKTGVKQKNKLTLRWPTPHFLKYQIPQGTDDSCSKATFDLTVPMLQRTWDYFFN